MHIINILRAIWTRYGVGFNNLSRSEQVEHHAQGSRAGCEAPHRRRFHQDVRIGQRAETRKETTSIVDQVASGLKDSTGVDLPSLLNGLLAKPDTDIDTTESPVD